MNMERKNPAGKIVLALVLIIAVLLAVILYMVWAKPAINGYVIEKQIEAKDIVLSSILAQLQQEGYVTIADQEGNSIVLVPAQQQQPAE